MRKFFHLFSYLAIGIFILSACSSSSNPIEDDGTDSLELTSLTPTTGSRGTIVRLEGKAFKQGASVCFASNCNTATVLSETSMTVTVPSGSGTVDVSVKQGVSEASLSQAFTYEGVDIAAPTFTSMSSSGGKAGDKINILGSGFSGNVEVCFASSCVVATLNSERSISVIVPEGSGSVPVQIKIGSTVLIAGSFTYVSVNDNGIDWCILRTINAAQAQPQTDSALIFSELYEEGCTPDSPAKCSHLKVELGYIKADGALGDPNAYTWQAAERNKLFSQDSAGNNDEYMGKLNLAEGDYRYLFRASLDGSTWTYCDGNGSNVGIDANHIGKIRFSNEVEQAIGWCRIMTDSHISSKIGEKSPGIYAQVFVKDCTKKDSPCPGLVAQLGYGSPAISTLEGISEGYTWKEAAFNSNYDGSGGELHNEFGDALSSEVAGKFSVVARFKMNDGAWYYCDTSDDNVFSPAHAVTWEVEFTQTTEKTVEWCRVQSPYSSSVFLGQESEIYYGRAYVGECTGPNHECPNLQAELGYGKSDQQVENFTWTKAVYNAGHVDSNNDEFGARINSAQAGEFAVAYRFSLDGTTWVYCDFDDAAGFAMEKAAKLTVQDPSTKEISWCKIQSPSTLSVEKNVESDNIYGRVYVDGCTQGAEKCEIVKAAVGYGSTDASDPSGFTWVEASYNPGHISDNNDEYAAKLTVDAAGEYAVAYRFSVDGVNWTYCDTDENPGYQKESATQLTVTEPPPQTIDWCNVQYPSETESVINQDSPTIYGRVFVSNCTENEKKCEDVSAYIGYAIEGSSEFTYVPATYNEALVEGNNDEYLGTLNIGVAGTYRYIYAFSLDGGATKTQCHVGNESAEKFDIAKAGKIIVNPTKPINKIEASCGIIKENISFELNINDTKDIYAQIYIPDCTNINNHCDKIVASHFLTSSNSTLPIESWTSLDASRNTNPTHANQNNEEYFYKYTAAARGRYNFAFSFDLKNNPNDETEPVQKIYCFADWQEYGFGSIIVN